MSAHSSVLRQPDELADLHIFVVPLELWLEKYRTAFNNIALESVSAGFVRVQPYVSLNYLRDHIEEQLGAEVIPEDYVFLRSVGRCMAVVKENQERLLKAKDFLPPVSYTPEIFILPGTHESVARPVENAANTVIQTHGLTTAGLASVQQPHQFPGIPGGYMQYPQAGAHVVAGGYTPSQQTGQVNQKGLQRRDVEAFNRVSGSDKSISDDEGGSDNERSLEHATGRYQLLEDGSGGSSENDEGGRAVLKERVEQKDNQQNEGQGEHREMASAVPSKMKKSKMQKKGSGSPSGTNQSEPKTVKFIQPEVYQGLPVTGPGGALISPPTPIPSGRVIASPLPRQPAAPVAVPSERESHSENSANSRKAAEKEGVADKKKKGELKGGKKKRRDRSRSPSLERTQPKELPDHLKGDNQVINVEHFEDQNNSTVFGEVTVSRVKSPPSLNEVEERSKFVQFPSPAKGNRQHVMNGDFEMKYGNQLTNGSSDREGAFGVDNFLQHSDFGDHGLAVNDNMNSSYNTAVEDGDADDEGNVKDTLLTEDGIVGLSGKGGDSKQGIANNAKKDVTKGTAAGNATKGKKMGKKPAKKPIESLEDKFKIPQIPKVPTPPPMKYPQRRDKEVGEDTASAKNTKQREIEELKAELRKAKNARVDMEKEREGKVRRAKMLQNQMMQKRNQSKNIWKKKFFDEKRKTGALDEQVNRLRHEVDVQHKALMSYLESKEREGNKPTAGSDYKSPSEKTNQRMSLVRLQHEVEELKRRIEELKMKLAAEMKNRDAAQKELKEIRQELLEKKINLTLTKSQKSLATSANPENIAV